MSVIPGRNVIEKPFPILQPKLNRGTALDTLLRRKLIEKGQHRCVLFAARGRRGRNNGPPICTSNSAINTTAAPSRKNLPHRQIATTAIANTTV